MIKSVFLSIIAIVLLSQAALAYNSNNEYYYMTRQSQSCFGQEGYYYDKICLQCPENCLKCANENSCTECKVGYGLNTDGTACVACDGSNVANCKWCDIDGSRNVASIATACTSPAQLFGGYCFLIDNCKKYSFYGTCTRCANGYYVNNVNYCSQCMTNCLTCTGPNQCIACEVGYFLTTNSQRQEYDIEIGKNINRCKKCNQNCICESAANQCQSCIPDTLTARYLMVPVNGTNYCREIAIDTSKFCKTFTNSLKTADKDLCTECKDSSTYVELQHLAGKAYDSKILVKCMKMRSDPAKETEMTESNSADVYKQTYMSEQDYHRIKINLDYIEDLDANDVFQKEINSLRHCNKFTVLEESLPDWKTKQRLISYRFKYLSCDVCDNGYYDKEVEFNFTFEDGTNWKTFNKTLKVCRKCSLDIVSDDPNQKQLVRRCTPDGAGVKVTQCGSSKIDLYPFCYNCEGQSNAEECVYRGPNVETRYSHRETDDEKRKQYLLRNDGVCHENTLACKGYVFSSDNYLNCTSCYSGYYLTELQDCINCPSKIPNCQNCSHAGSGFNCIACVNSYYFVYYPDKKCYPCSKNISNCERCEIQYDQLVCLQCAQNYTYNSEKKECNICTQNTKIDYCAKLVNDNNQCVKCASCLDGFGLMEQAMESGISDLYCVKCPNYCLKCDQNICTKCAGTHILENGICKRRKNGCAHYVLVSGSQETYVCNQCEYGYKLNDRLGSCQPCMAFQQALTFTKSYGFYDCPYTCNNAESKPTNQSTNVQRTNGYTLIATSRILKLLDDDFIEN